MTDTWFNPSLNWKERGLPKPGRKTIEDGAVGLAERLGVSYRRIRRAGVQRLIACSDDSARMLILGGRR